MFDKGQAMLLWALECQPEITAEWNEWYNLEHLSSLVQVPGFISGNRYEQVESSSLSPLNPRFPAPRYLSFYELYDEKVLDSEAYHINRTSTGPGMRPEWTKRMLTYITSIMGGTYKPLTDTWLNDTDRTAQNMWALFFDPEEYGEEKLDHWYNDQLFPILKENESIKACRLIGTDQSSPKVQGGVQQLKGPRRILLCAVQDQFNPEVQQASLVEAWRGGRDFISAAQAVLYKRMSIK